MKTKNTSKNRLYKFEETDREITCSCLRDNCLLITFETGQVEIFKLQHNYQIFPEFSKSGKNVAVVPCCEKIFLSVFGSNLETNEICSKIGSYQCYSYATCCDIFFTKDDIFSVVGTKSGDIYVFSVRNNCLFRLFKKAHKSKIKEREKKKEWKTL